MDAADPPVPKSVPSPLTLAVVAKVDAMPSHQIAGMTENELEDILVSLAAASDRIRVRAKIREAVESGQQLKNISGSVNLDAVVARYTDLVKARRSAHLSRRSVVLASSQSEPVMTESALLILAQDRSEDDVLVLPVDCTPDQLATAIALLSSPGFAVHRSASRSPRLVISTKSSSHRASSSIPLAYEDWLKTLANAPAVEVRGVGIARTIRVTW